MIYNVIGLMSGSSHDGLDIAFAEITNVRNDWTFEIKHAACIPFEKEMEQQLRHAATLPVPEFLKLHTAFGRWTGQQVIEFIETNALYHKVHFVASHGHTVFHDPESKTSVQIGDGASISGITGLPTITDLRNADIALAGQGAPIVPIADHKFFSDFKYCLNIGGICNVTINDAAPVAFDIAPANQVLDYFAQKAGQAFDENGALAAQGKVADTVLNDLNTLAYYQTEGPKSLANDYSQQLISIIENSNIANTADILATLVAHIVFQIARAIDRYPDATPARMLVTGGGAFNSFLIAKLSATLQQRAIEVVIPEENIVKYKEALAMAFIGVLRWREEENVLS
ncbi:MAG: anhydro-N-acetylmuramic acid kinase, partial [Sphingobacteriales bacterium]